MPRVGALAARPVARLGASVALALATACCGGAVSRTTARDGPAPPARAVLMTATPTSALRTCTRGRLLRPVCPRRIPSSGQPSSPYVVAGCSGGTRTTNVPLTSKDCRFAQWSYLASGVPLPGTRGKDVTFLSRLPPSPPYFVHVLVYVSRGTSGLPFALPEGRARRLSDALLQSNRTRAVSLGWVRWAGRYGQLMLAPSYPRGGEVGDHLIFGLSAEGVYYGITLHPWPSVFRFSASGGDHTLVFHSGSSYPQVVATLKAIVTSALRG